MNYRLLTKYIPFAIGGVVGVVIPFFVEVFKLNSPLVLFAPAKVGLFLAHLVLQPICWLSTTNICRGLGFDGGPLEWVEWTGVCGGMIIGYGLLFQVVFMMYRAYKKKKMGK